MDGSWVILYYQISKELPVITNAYRQHTEQQNRALRFQLTIISLLFFILLITLFFIQKHRKALSVARHGLDETNRNLEEMNTKLNLLNQELSESDKIKEEYIGHFIDLYSDYVERLDDYRKMINNKIAAKRFDELLKMTSSQGSKTDNVKELNANFDKAFLNIYPGFVTSFNELLKEEEQFEAKKRRTQYRTSCFCTDPVRDNRFKQDCIFPPLLRTNCVQLQE